jgi:hypothetical protein
MVREIRKSLITGTTRIWLQITFLFSTALVALWPIIPSAFSADDTFDSFTPFQLKYLDKSPWSFITEETQNWMTTQGRFFPGAITIGTYAHYFFPNRTGYKALQLAVALIALGTFYILIRFLVRSHRIAILSTLISLCAMQFKVQYDPLLQFSLQQPALMIIFFLSVLSFSLGIRKNKSRYLFGSAILYFLALLTYETTVLLWPFFVFVLILENPPKWRLKLVSTIVAPTVISINLLVLRSRIEVAAAGYTSNFEPGPLTRTLFRQLLASMPMSYSEIQTPLFIEDFPNHVHIQTGSWWLGIAGALALTLWVIPNLPLINTRRRLALIGIGLTLWITPALVVAQTVRWQGELELGNGYITAYQGYFGFSLFAVGILLSIKSILKNCSLRWQLLFDTVIVALICISISSIITNNRFAVAQYNPGYLWPRNHFEDAVSSGVFDVVESDSVLFSTQAEWWFNAPLIYWFGGPRVEEVITSRNAVNFADCVTEIEICQNRLSLSHAFNTYGIFPSETRATVVGSLEYFQKSDESISGVLINNVSVYVQYPSASFSVSESELRCRSWLASRLEMLNTPIDSQKIRIKRATVSSCNAILPEEIVIDLIRFTP